MNLENILKKASQILKKTFPRSSSKPFLQPATEKAWQGNPAHKISFEGIEGLDIYLTDLYNQSTEFFQFIPIILYKKRSNGILFIFIIKQIKKK